MGVITVKLEMESYIGHPYWPEKNLCIDIEKTSGVNRQKSDEKRLAAIKAECKRRGMTYQQYLDAKKASERPFYTAKNGAIIIPRHQLAGAIAQAIGESPKGVRGPYTKDNFRALVRVSDFTTDRKKADGTFSRFVKLDSSNQRSYQQNPFIGQYLDPATGMTGKPFTAEGTLHVLEDKWHDTVKGLLTHAVEVVGLGAARKMGFGRGKVVDWKVQGNK